MSETSVKGPCPYGEIVLATTAVLVLAVTVWSLFLPLVWHPKHQVKRVSCQSNLKQLGLVSLIYADDHDGQYPAAERWCDVLADGYVEAETFRCPKAETRPCNYAMNPHADPNSAGDVVLLFESKPGWNQFGGRELLTTENHEGRGCSVLFVDGHVEFVKAEKLAGLKWVDEKTLPRELDTEQQPVNDEGQDK